MLHQNVSLSGSQIKLCYALVLWYDIVGTLDAAEDRDWTVKARMTTGRRMTIV